MASWNTAYPWTPAQDAELRRAYEAGERCSNKRLAARFGVRPQLISARAAKLGLPPLVCNPRRTVARHWQAEEIALVRAHLDEPTAQLRARLYRSGHGRSLSSIRNLITYYRRRGEWPTRADQVDATDSLTVAELTAGLGVGRTTVDGWIKRGWLRARTVGASLLAVRWADLRRFLRDYAAHWDHRKADRWFLIEALTYRAPTVAARKKAA